MDGILRARLGTIAAAAAPALLVLYLVAAPLWTGVAEITLGLALAAALAARLVGGRPDCWPAGWHSLVIGGPSTNLVPLLWLVFIALYIVSIAAAVDFATSLGKLHKLFRYGLFFVPLAVPWRDGHWRAAFWAQLPLLVLVAWPAFESLTAGWGRAQTPNLHYNTLAQVAGGGSLLLIAAALHGPREARRERALFLLGAAAGAVLLVLTFSRAAWIGWWLGAMLLVLARVPRRVAVVVVVVVVLIPAIVLPILRASRPTMLDLENPEFTRRYDMWRMARALIADHPWTGIGPGGMGAVYDDYKTGVLVEDEKVWVHVHNDVLEVALSHGLPAAVVWVGLVAALLVALARRLPRLRRRRGSWLKAGFAGAGGCLLLFYICGLVHDNYPIYVKACLLLLFWGQLVAADRALGTDASLLDFASEPEALP